MLETGGMEALAFLILHEVAHVVKGHTRRNLGETHRYGDLRKQLFFFENQYIGFDALMIEYYTNSRFTLDQELEADMFALRVMLECGLALRDVEHYRSILKVLENEKDLKKEIKYGTSPELHQRVKATYD